MFILDEAHERSVNTDVLLALLKKHLAKSSRFRLVIMSATMDVSGFLNFYGSDAVLLHLFEAFSDRRKDVPYSPVLYSGTRC